ncbi:MAG TPA: hypothetical protein PLP17_03935 [Oligoflexia bacterium]|nr:hypothetical protein [Oligoflexia bacterium]
MRFDEHDANFVEQAVNSQARADKIRSLSTTRRQQYFIVLLLLLMMLVEFAVMLGHRAYFSLPLILGFSFGGVLLAIMFAAWLRTDAQIKLLKVVEKIAG